MRTCKKCGKSRKNLWLSKNGYCEKCAEEILKGRKSSKQPFYKRKAVLAAGGAVLVLGLIGSRIDANSTQQPQLPEPTIPIVETQVPTERPTISPTLPPDEAPDPTPEPTIESEIAGALKETDQSASNNTSADITPDITIRPEPTPAPMPETTSRIVYRGETGTKYHIQTCRTLRNGAFPMTIEEALAEGREPCKICDPG